MTRDTDPKGSNHATAMGRRTRVLIGLAVLATAGWLFRDALASVATSVLRREESSHGILVPIIAAFLVRAKYGKIAGLRPEPDTVVGLAVAGAGILLFLPLVNGPGVVLPSLLFLMVLSGLILFVFGREVFREVRFPLFFLATMIPIPEPAYLQVSECMRRLTTWASVGMLQLSGFPIARTGYDIHLPHMDLVVGYGCSGIRYLISYLVFGLAYAYMWKRTLGSRTVLVLATVPISAFAGTLRQIVIFLGAHYVGPSSTEDGPHVLLSWSVFVVVLAAAVLLERRFCRRERHKQVAR